MMGPLSLPKSVAAVLAASIGSLGHLLVRAPFRWIVRAWRRREQRLDDEYWGLDSYMDTNVTQTLAAAGAEARSGCGCSGCERLRDQVTEVMFRLNNDDIAVLARYGIAWEAS